MVDVLTYKGRLPGVMVEVTPPSRGLAPLRLDVAGFVGFAERGPLDTPVMVEDISQYEAIFGGDLAVARDEGRPVYAHLPRAVQAFFDNGGRRCFVVRVAGDARVNTFHIPGLFTWDGDFAPVIQPAAWKGDWSDEVQVGAQLRSDPLQIPKNGDALRLLPESSTGLESIELDLEVPAPDTIRSGDLMRLHFSGVRVYLQVTVTPQTAPPQTLHSVPVTVTATTDRMLAFAVDFDQPTTLPVTVERMDGNDWVVLTSSPLPVGAGTSGEITLNLPVDETVVVGDVLRLTYAVDTVIYLPVTEVTRCYDDTITSEPFQEVVGDDALKALVLARDTVDLPLEQADRLTFDLYIREGQATLEIWRELSFGWGEASQNGTGETLPAANFWMDWLAQPVDPDVLSMTSEELQLRSLQLGAVDLPTDSAGEVVVPFYLPLGMSELQPYFNEPLPEVVSEGETLPASKNGLDDFDPKTMFLDDNFDGVGIGRIVSLADELLYLGSSRTKLVGVHSLLGVPEVALIALPDVVHRGWTDPEPPDEAESPVDEEEPEERDPTRFWDCEDEQSGEHEEAIAPPTPSAGANGDLASEIFLLPVLKAEDDYDITPMLDVQQALIELCAARATILAILSVPQHFDRRAVVSWQQQVASCFLGFSGEPLSYAAAYHGWVQIREETTPALAPLRDVPPDGTVVGMIAARELARGPWIAPANESLYGMVGLVHPLTEDDQVALFNRRINVLVQQPGRFTLMSAHTLSADRLFLQISIRRLLIFLRKLLLREGDRWVFETNNARFRQYVQASLERILSRIMELGGLAAFEVVTGSEVNTPNDYDQGRFIVAIKIAPTHPIEFITVVLLRTGESLLELIER